MFLPILDLATGQCPTGPLWCWCSRGCGETWDLSPLEEFGMGSWSPLWPIMVRGCPGQAQMGPALGTLCASQVGAQPGPQLDVQLRVVRWLQAGLCAEC